MVLAIAQKCESKGATVWMDPASVDVLADFGETELIVEVKSVTSHNLVRRLRTAIGQLLQYDYYRSRESDKPRRRAIGFAATVPTDAWYVAFLNEYLDMDLLSLNGDDVVMTSKSAVWVGIFSD
jgi:hypothetical protein